MAHKAAGSFDLDVLGSLSRLADGALANSTISRLVQNAGLVQTPALRKSAADGGARNANPVIPAAETGKTREGPIDLGAKNVGAGPDSTKTASNLGGAPQDPAYTSPGAREAHGANVDGHLDGGEDAEIVTWRKYIAKVACDLVAARRADTFEATSKAALPHETVNTVPQSVEKQSLLRNPTLPANYSITGQPQANPVQAATNAAVVGPGTSPSTNPIGSFGPLAANPGEVTGNSALGVQHNVLKMGQWAAFGSLLDALGMEEQPDGTLRALSLSEVRAKQAVTINKAAALDPRGLAASNGVGRGASLGLMAGAGYGGYRGWTGYGSPESEKRTIATKLLHAVLGAGGGAVLGASSGGMLGGLGAVGMHDLQAAKGTPKLPVPPAPPELTMPKAGGFFGKKKPRSKPVKPLGRFITREEIMAYKPTNKTAAADFGDRLARLWERRDPEKLEEANPFRHGDCADAPRTFRYSLRLKEAGAMDTVMDHPATPFVAQPVIGAGISLGVNELMRRLSEAYVGKPAKEDEISRGRFMAAGVGAGMGLSRAARPHIEAWGKSAALTLPAALHSQAKPGFGKPKKPVTGGVAAPVTQGTTTLAPKLANWVEQLMQTGFGQVPGVQAMLGGSSGQAPASGGSSVIASPSMPAPVPPAQNPGQVSLPQPAVPQQTPSSPGMSSVANQPIDVSKPGMMGAGPAAKSLPQSFAAEMGSQMKAPQVPMKPSVIPPAGGAQQPGAGLVKTNANLYPSMMFEDNRPDRPQLRKEQIEPTTLYGNEALDYVKKRFQRTKLHGRGTTAE